tara:strand:+ start:1879 stop:2121 length:243 start_codon:yes stop_codon:yes gene_type:complete
MIQTQTITENETTYSGYKFTIKKTTYSVVKVTGKHNYINVKQENNRRSNFGKNFKTFDEAAKSYKNPQIKIELLKIELGL